MEDTDSALEHPGVSLCLLSNWQEERAAAALDNAPSAPGHTKEGQEHRHGHRGILSTQLLADMATSTTFQDSYRRPSSDHRRQQPPGVREEKLRKSLYYKFSQDILEEMMSPTDEVNITDSTTRRDYQVEGFIPQILAPSKKHDYHSEPAITFWTENVHRSTGVSDIRTSDLPFKRSSAFTTPISHYLDQPVPHGMENYPNM